MIKVYINFIINLLVNNVLRSELIILKSDKKKKKAEFNEREEHENENENENNDKDKDEHKKKKFGNKHSDY